MKLDVMSVVMIIFCLTVCISLFVEVKHGANTTDTEAVIANSN